MPYVATQRISHTPLRTDTLREYLPGDVIDDFHTWPTLSQQALLSCGWIKPVADAPAPSVSDEVKPAAAEPVVEAEAAVVADAEVEEDGEMQCELCPRAFASERALKSHRTKIHGGL